MSSSGLFAAGTTAGGPYTVTASSAGVNGTAAVTVTASTGAISYIQGANGTSDGGATSISQTFATANSSGDLIVAAVSWGNNGTVTCSDSLGNTYAAAMTQYDSVSNQALAICYATNVKAGSNTVQASFSISAPYRRLEIHEYSGAATVSPVDVTKQNVANGTTAGDAITSGSGTTIANGDLIFGAVMDVTGTTSITAGTGFVQRQSVNNKDLATEDLIQVAAGPIAATQTFGAAHRYLAQMVAFTHR